MSQNYWLLPDGMDELTGDDASALEEHRLKALKVFSSWRYELITPPLIEHADSLLTGLGEALSQQTFRMTDHATGKILGLRSDMSPQAARIDARQSQRTGVNRLCYAGPVVHASQRAAMGNRSFLQVGAECFGVESIDADAEIIGLMLDTLSCLISTPITLELAHQCVYQWLTELSQTHQLNGALLRELVANKRLPELDQFIANTSLIDSHKIQLMRLPRLMGDLSVLDEAERLFSGEALVLSALSDLRHIARSVHERFPEQRLFFNLGEFSFSGYHSGLTFAAYTERQHVPVLLANGGRYDDVGAVFGRQRPATGFSADLSLLSRLATEFISSLGSDKDKKTTAALLPAEDQNRMEFWRVINHLRRDGYAIQLCYSQEEYVSAGTVFELAEAEGSWVCRAR